MTIDVYTFEGQGDETTDESTQSWAEAVELARSRLLAIIANTYEWTDSELVADYRPSLSDQELDAALNDPDRDYALPVGVRSDDRYTDPGDYRLAEDEDRHVDAPLRTRASWRPGVGLVDRDYALPIDAPPTASGNRCTICDPLTPEA